MDKKSRSDLRKQNRKSNRPIYCLFLRDGRTAYSDWDHHHDERIKEYIQNLIKKSEFIKNAGLGTPEVGVGRSFFIRGTLAKVIRLLDRFDPERKGLIVVRKPNRKERIIATAIFANE